MLTALQLVAKAKTQIREVTPIDAVKFLRHGALCLDVREAAESEMESLPGAIRIPRGVLEFRIADYAGFADKRRTMLVYCTNGARSALAVVALKRMGYSGAVSLAGGIESWNKQGLPLSTDMTIYGG
jgi:rhodanese-related sulfurtransferase